MEATALLMLAGREVVPGVALTTVAVLLSAVMVGALAAAILGLELLEGMQLGSVIASTDAPRSSRFSAREAWPSSPASVTSSSWSRGATIRPPCS